MSKLKGVFDIHIDSAHRWDVDRVLEIDAYPLVHKEHGVTETDTLTTLASVRIPSFNVPVDMWVASSNMSEISLLPQFVKDACATVVALALIVEGKK
jgi:hypothetical protein